MRNSSYEGGIFRMRCWGIDMNSRLMLVEHFAYDTPMVREDPAVTIVTSLWVVEKSIVAIDRP